ncbi:hrp regulatory protein HrpS [Anopheles sinensis]|uniref:Hrp regulatory protein HrpS n=1 Tax=Anopheles sinensis TaxID=74873 RepID=A0A084WL65_ANOSI|nr:hrp regulatory protein HrpS [Anopheles sinensis]
MPTRIERPIEFYLRFLGRCAGVNRSQSLLHRARGGKCEVNNVDILQCAVANAFKTRILSLPAKEKPPPPQRHLKCYSRSSLRVIVDHLFSTSFGAVRQACAPMRRRSIMLSNQPTKSRRVVLVLQPGCITPHVGYDYTR